MKIAFMFPGQGAQFVGMGKDFFDEYKEARQVYEKAEKIVGKSISKMCFEGSLEDLSNTINTQLAISTTSLAILAVLKKYDIHSNIDVGLSLGEYVALINSNILSFETGVKLLERRSYFMANKIASNAENNTRDNIEKSEEVNLKNEQLNNEKYSMIAVIGLAANKIEAICKQAEGFAVPANYNYSGQVVVTGEESVIEKITIKLQEEGAKRVVKLNTSGPFHTQKLEEASKCYRNELEKAQFTIVENRVIKNLDGKFYTKEDDVKDILAKHIISPVRFDKTIQTMIKEGIDTYIEIGPRKSTIRFCKKRKQRSKSI